MTDIQAIAARFHAATDELAAAKKKLTDIDLDLAIAERNKQPTEEISKARNLVLMGEWAPAHANQKAAAHALCEALSIDALTLRIALA
jgi:hypothetical protein